MLARVFAHFVLIALALGAVVSIRSYVGFFGPIVILAVTYLGEGIIIWRFKKLKSSLPIQKNKLPPSIVTIVVLLWISAMLLLIPIFSEGFSTFTIPVDLGILAIVLLFGIGIWGESKNIIQLWRHS